MEREKEKNKGNKIIVASLIIGILSISVIATISFMDLFTDLDGKKEGEKIKMINLETDELNSIGNPATNYEEIKGNNTTSTALAIIGNEIVVPDNQTVYDGLIIHYVETSQKVGDKQIIAVLVSANCDYKYWNKTLAIDFEYLQNGVKKQNTYYINLKDTMSC